MTAWSKSHTVEDISVGHGKRKSPASDSPDMSRRTIQIDVPDYVVATINEATMVTSTQMTRAPGEWPQLQED